MRNLRSGGVLAAFSLIEVMIAIMLSVIALSTFYASAGQAIRVVKTGKETANASQLLQQRVEAFRSASQWVSITTPTGVSTLVSAATDSAGNFPGATETVTINSYPTAGTPIVVTRTASGTVTTSGASLSTQRCVKMTIEVTWTAAGHLPRSRQLATILTKGGL